MNRLLSAVGVVLAASSLGACATVTRGTSTAWAVNSAPAGATVRTSNGYMCETPCSINMPRRSTFIATIEHPGYREAQLNVTNRVSVQGGAAFVGNALIGGLIGATIDVATGATQDLTPDDSLIALQRDEAVAADAYGLSLGQAAPPVASGETVIVSRF